MRKGWKVTTTVEHGLSMAPVLVYRRGAIVSCYELSKGRFIPAAGVQQYTFGEINVAIVFDKKK